MASFSRKASNFALIFSPLVISSTIIQVSCFQYEVGGERGWIKPDGSEHETYNEWAQHHRFHIGDTLYFKYTSDSVLVVSSQDYGGCSLNNPVSKFEDGNTVFEFDHSGFYYFISGQPGHCQAGQKMIVWVMGFHHSNSSMISGSPASSPASEPEGPTPAGNQGTNADSWGPSQSQSQSQSNSGRSASILLINVFMGVVTLLYVFIEY
ncbi:hypothetical protein Cgig2_022229 [Carnegiea gigantea]|uniref:Phytocyanin domain-containing protein n=1 Tax=Carnegiea gigantea TaxID=171969 RepID=A0A9Q1KHC3_9CARY|nr:hypothetical protein Cgig2_022229 [Carnegiea gigantea]